MMAKKAFDFFLALVGLAVLVPLFLCIAVLVKLDSNGPVFFRQVRVGRNQRHFEIFKFRTMSTADSRLGAQITSDFDPRITRAGKYLRQYKLDELPQLINVLKGEMSLVGPRPEVPQFVDYWPEPDRRHILSVLPGITDFASIEFRDEASLLKHATNAEQIYINEIIPIKIEYYKRYVDERSFILDLKLILKTLVMIFR